MDMEFGNLQKEIFIKVSGKITNKMEKEYLLTLDRSIADILRISWNTAEVKRISLMEINTLASTNMESLMVLEDISGRTETPTTVNSFKDQDKAEEQLQRKMVRVIKAFL